MMLDAAVVADLTRTYRPSSFVRIMSATYRATPLGMGPGDARFSSGHGKFCTLYAAATLETAVAEAIIRDRFEAVSDRLLFLSELGTKCVVQISAAYPLDLLDLRKDGCFLLGISTDIASAKGWKDSRELAEILYGTTALDGVLYRSRLTGSDCIAVFDRAVVDKLTATGAIDLLSTPLLPSAMDRLRTKVV